MVTSINKSRVKITSIKVGSIVVSFYILADSFGGALAYSTTTITVNSITTAYGPSPSPEPARETSAIYTLPTPAGSGVCVAER